MERQFAKLVYLRQMAAMKGVLDLGEFKIGSRDSGDFRYFKKVVMDQFYDAMSDVFASMEAAGLLRKCPCGTRIRQGYKDCPLCSGAGHCNAGGMDELLDGLGIDDQPGLDA